MSLFPFKSRKAFSLVELLLVLGVMAVILVAAFVVYPRVKREIVINEEMTNLRMVSANIKSRFPLGNFYGLSNTYTREAKIAPTSWLDPENDWRGGLTNPFGGSVHIQPMGNDNYGFNDNPRFQGRFRITYGGLTSEYCVPMALRSEGLAEEIHVVASAETSGTPETLVNPRDINSVVAKCNAQGKIQGLPYEQYNLVLFVR